MRKIVPSAVFVWLLVTGCSGEAKKRVVTLPSGRPVNVVRIVKSVGANSPPALVMEYETRIPISDTAHLTEEAEDIWQSFRNDVEGANLTTGVLRASAPEHGFIVKTAEGFNFVYKRAADGAWSRPAASH